MSSAESAPEAEILKVTGGVAGIAATRSRMIDLARDYDQLGNQLRGLSRLGPKVLGDVDLLESAVLSPTTFGQAEWAVLLATTGPDGLLSESVRWELTAHQVRLVVTAFAATDALVAAAMDQLDAALFATTVSPAALTIAAGMLLDPETTQLTLANHPGYLEHLLNGATGVLDVPWLPGFPSTAADGAAMLAGLFPPEGAPQLGPPVPSASAAPADLTALLANLAAVNAMPEGTIEVQSVVGPDGKPRYVVYLPGTDDLLTLPWTQDDTVRDGAANLHIFANQDTTYALGVLAALGAAGVGADDPVLLVGHSQGGITASHLAQSGHAFNITHVVTAGAPGAQAPPPPPGVSVLALEHHGDPVPLLDGSANPDLVHQVSVTFDAGAHPLIANHDLEHYVAGAAAVQDSDSVSVQVSVAELHEAGFLGADPATAEAHTFTITR